MSDLVYFKWYLDEASLMKEEMTEEQAGKLFLAVMDYLRDGTITELPLELKILYANFRQRVDRAKSKYNEKTTKLAENGAKGGRAKAQKSKVQAETTATTHADSPNSTGFKFKPPTLTQFREAVDDMAKSGEIELPERVTVDRLFASLDESCWKFNGEPIKRRNDWECIILTRFSAMDTEKARFYRLAFDHLFCNFNGYRNKNGDTLAEETAQEFCDDYSEDLPGWEINGKVFAPRDWKAALEAYADP